MTPNVQIAVQLYPDRAADYKWFDLGRLPSDKEYTHREVAQLVTQPLPFNKLALSGMDTDDWVFGILITKEEEGSEYEGAIRLETSMAVPEQKQVLTFWVRPEQQDILESLELSFADPKHYANEDAIETSRVCAMVFAWFMETLHQSDVKYQMYTATPKSNNAKRIRQGKKPMFDWHTVVIEPPRQKMPDQGGTHASPRLHDVRGHWVTRGGKKYWRKAHQRGDASKGIVFHDYKLKGETNDCIA